MGRKRSSELPAGNDSGSDKDPRFVEALARGLAMLRVFRPDDRWLSHREIVKRTGLPAATVSRLAFTLVSLGYLRHRSEAGEYALSLAVLGLGFSVLSNFEVGRVARPYMQVLADQCQAAVSLGVRHELNMVYVAHCRSRARLTLGLDVGARMPAVRTAMGRAVLAVMALPEREALLRRAEAESPTAWPAMRERLAQVQAQYDAVGFVTSECEWESDISAAGAPVDVGDGRLLFGLTVGGPSAHLQGSFLHQEVGPLLVSTARTIVDALRAADWQE